MGDTLIESGRGLPTHGDFRYERHEVTLNTDSAGAASTTQAWDEEYEDGTTVTAHVTGTTTGDYFASAAGGTQGTIEVSGGPASTAVTAYVLVIGAE